MVGVVWHLSAGVRDALNFTISSFPLNYNMKNLCVTIKGVAVFTAHYLILT